MMMGRLRNDYNDDFGFDRAGLVNKRHKRTSCCLAMKDDSFPHLTRLMPMSLMLEGDWNPWCQFEA